MKFRYREAPGVLVKAELGGRHFSWFGRKKIGVSEGKDCLSLII